jgi:hypothetical protein
MNLYKRFCCALYYFFRDIVRSSIPIFATFMFTLFLFTFLFYGIDTVIYLFFKTPYFFENVEMYATLILFGIFNYIFVFKNRELFEYPSKPLHPLLTIIIVTLIFGCSLAVIFYAGPRNLPTK